MNDVRHGECQMAGFIVAAKALVYGMEVAVVDMEYEGRTLLDCLPIVEQRERGRGRARRDVRAVRAGTERRERGGGFGWTLEVLD